LIYVDNLAAKIRTIFVVVVVVVVVVFLVVFFFSFAKVMGIVICMSTVFRMSWVL